jgi:o-succinylbenzoate synthase
VTADPLLPVDGALPVGPARAEPERLAALAAPPDRRAWWLHRLRRCAALLGTAGAPEVSGRPT